MKSELEKYNYHQYSKEKEGGASEDFYSFLIANSSIKPETEIDVDSAFTNALEQINSNRTSGGFKKSAPLLKVAAAIALVTTISIAFIFQDFWRGTETIVAGNKRIEFALPDGSTVTLNKNSTLTFAKSFKNNRNVTLGGEGFFEVVSTGIPFSVTANETTVNVLGTAFNVNETKESVSVYVEHGLVSFEDEKNEVKLSAGQMATYINDEASFVEDRNISNITSWKDGTLQFKNAALDNVVKDLKRHYGVEIFMASEKLKSCRVTAAFENESLSKVFQTLESILDVSISKKKNQYKISGKGC
ncbi:MAG: FecR domain-containing protein [Bacteroidota bacterium]